MKYSLSKFDVVKGIEIMNKIRIKDIYAGMPDAKDEIMSGQTDNFLASFILPPELDVEKLLNGQKYLIMGYKGVGKTSVLYYLQDQAQKRNPSTCCSFMYFKSNFEEIRKSNMEIVSKKLMSLIDINGDIQFKNIEYLHLWRWVFFKKIVDDSSESKSALFKLNSDWRQFVSNVNKISFSSQNKNVISLSSLSVELEASSTDGISSKATAEFNRIAKNESRFREMIDIVDECERLFKKITRTDVPYYIFIDEMEAYYGDSELFKRDLTLIRDMLFTINRINSYGKVHIIAAVRNEIIYAMDRFVQTNEINKITDGFGVPINWSYSNTNSFKHPIIKILLKRISVADNGQTQKFYDWFPKKLYNKDSVNYILDNSWCKPRDIVRLLIAAQNDSLHCCDTIFTQAAFDSLRKEYSKNSLTEIRQELQSLYTMEEIEMIIKLLRGGYAITTPEQIRKSATKGSKARQFWDERNEDILEDLYRIGFWGNVNRAGSHYLWRWNHKGDTGVLIKDNWELAIHPALYTELSLQY